MTSWPLGNADSDPSSTENQPPDTPECVYYCLNGVWVLCQATGGSGYYCPPELPGACTINSVKRIPAIPIQNTVAELQENMGEYVYTKGASTLRLARGSCTQGLMLYSEIAISDLARIAPDTAALLSALRFNDNVSTFHLLIPAQPVNRA